MLKQQSNSSVIQYNGPSTSGGTEILKAVRYLLNRKLNKKEESRETGMMIINTRKQKMI
jgi:hypothetical protein